VKQRARERGRSKETEKRDKEGPEREREKLTGGERDRGRARESETERERQNRERERTGDDPWPNEPGEPMTRISSFPFRDSPSFVLVWPKLREEKSGGRDSWRAENP
jgi:hypothetical protein